MVNGVTALFGAVAGKIFHAVFIEFLFGEMMVVGHGAEEQAGESDTLVLEGIHHVVVEFCRYRA